MKNIHRIFEKTAQYKPYEFDNVNTVTLILQLLSFILITKFCQSFDDMIAVGYSAEIVLEKEKSSIKTLCY